MFFKYRALKNDKIVQGKLESLSESDALVSLKTDGFFPIEVLPADESHSFLANYTNKISFTDVVNLTRQLSIMLNAGLTLIDCFQILKEQITKPALRQIVVNIDSEIRGGKTFSSVLKKYPQYFSNLYIALIRSGEASGKLSDILVKLADNLEKERAFKAKVKGALIYPATIVVAMIGLAFIMMTVVLPKLLVLYKDFNIDLPLPTQILIFLSNFSVTFAPFIIGGTVVGIFLAKRYLRTTQGKYKLDSLMLRMPLFSNVIKMSVLVDLTRTLSILIGSGISILDALTIVIETTSNLVFQQAFRDIYQQVEKGVSVGQAMQNGKIFPTILVQMTTVGEETGHLDETLGRISNYFQVESEETIKTITSLIEPTILVVLGFGVAFLVMAVIMPIFSLTSSFK